MESSVAWCPRTERSLLELSEACYGRLTSIRMSSSKLYTEGSGLPGTAASRWLWLPHGDPERERSAVPRTLRTSRQRERSGLSR